MVAAWQRRIAVVSLAAVCLTAVAPAAAADRREEEQFLAGLGARHLYRLAEAYCRRRLEQPEQLAPDEHAWLVAELVRSCAQQAGDAPPKERERFWQAAAAAASEFVAAYPQHPRRLVVEAQAAFADAARGELDALEAAIAAQPESALEQARETLRAAARALEQLNKRLADPALQVRANPSRPGALSEAALFALQTQVREQLARTYKSRSLCFAPGSNDRIAALQSAVRLLDGSLSRIPVDDPAVAELQLERAQCQRLLGDHALATQALMRLAGQTHPATFAARLRAEQVRLELARGQVAEADRLAQPAPDAAAAPEPELDLARLEVLIAHAQADSGSIAGRWQQQALAQVPQIAERYGPYWGRRAELLLVSSGSRLAGGESAELLGRTADELYRKQSYDEAIATYDKAAGRAAASGSSAAAFGWSYKAALVEQQREQYEKAAERLRQLSLSGAEDARAADTHLLAAWNLAQAARRDAKRLDDYRQALDEQLQKWPAGAASDTARVWLGKLCEGRGEWPAAAAAYAGVSPQADGASQAVAAAGRCWLRQFQSAGRAAPVAAADVEAVAVKLEQLARGSGRDPVPPPFAAEAAIAAARLRLAFTSTGYALAEAQLRPVTELNNVNNETSTTAWALLVVAVAGQPGRAAEALQLFQQHDSPGPDVLLEILQDATGFPATITAASTATLRLAVADSLTRLQSGLSVEQQVSVARQRAAALADGGRCDEALQVLGQLATDHPQDVAVQEQYAQLLLDGTTPEAWKAALDRWRTIATHSRPGSELWFRAKYSVALAQYRLQDRESAAQLLRYVLATAPIGQTPWQARFEQLLAKCQSGQTR